MLAILFPQIDPIFFEVGPIAVRWYAIAYLVGIVLGYLLIKKLNASHTQVFPVREIDDLIFFSVLGIVIGGRIGYIFFYDFYESIRNPIRIFYIWKGGMSFHGGVIGLTFSTFLYSKKYKINFLNALDMISLVAPIGLFFGRVANFINAELYGRASDLPWAVIFPNAGNFGRHPSQIYEAICEGVILFAIMYIAFKKIDVKKNPGKLGAVFLICYSLIRIFVECFREPDFHIGFFFETITMGQILSIPMLAIGLYFFFRRNIKFKA